MTESSEADVVKLKRNTLLTESDWKQANDSSLTDAEKNTLNENNVKKNFI